MQEDLFPLPRFVLGVLEQAGVDLEEMLRRCDSPSADQARGNRIRLRTARSSPSGMSWNRSAFHPTSACG